MANIMRSANGRGLQQSTQGLQKIIRIQDDFAKFPRLQILLLVYLCDATLLCTRVKSPLKLENRSDSFVKGCYCQNERLSLCFEIQLGFIQLTDTNNIVLVRFRMPSRQKTHVKVLGNNFLWPHPDSEPFFIGKESNVWAEDSISERVTGLLKDMRQSSSMLYQRAMTRLQKKPEIQLLSDVSHALQDEGEARENVLIKSFHVMSMSLLGKPGDAAHTRDKQTAAHRYLKLFNRKRGTCKDLRGDPDKNECLGMCGAGCWCWNLVCNDCCHHQGSYQHDLCCRKKRLSGYCLFPFLYGFNCNSYGGYPSCV
ncbi:uncharacterized protein LOC111344831 [Stylophora pistillata]|uniref:uncharacterized protein LOC111344831 n=1 Tax=Stylophora pistillata TaxID=50429 RepID=UPI000C04C82A|nr:uncharacterized protein LOC111344831 [Stylophora pistillata]